MALSRLFKEDRRELPVFPRLSLPEDRWWDVLGFVPAGTSLNLLNDSSRQLRGISPTIW